MAFDWFNDLNEAKSYFTNERLITTHWDSLTDAQKTKVIIQSYNWIYYSNRFSVPTKANATAAELVVLKKAQGECAYFLAEHLSDMDTRKGLQAQGVIEAGIVKEVYDVNRLDTLPFPAIVLQLLQAFGSYIPFAAKEIGRDEEFDIDEDIIS